MPEPFLAILSHSPSEPAWCSSSHASQPSREANEMIGRSGLAVTRSPFNIRRHDTAPGRSLWVRQIIYTKHEFAALASNTSSMLSPVEMAEPPDQLANLRAARARAFPASASRFLGDALVSSEASSLLETAAISSTAA